MIPQLFESIIYNLCDNGIKYNKENGKVDITVKDELDFVTISIQDTGIGIPREDHQRIFDENPEVVVRVLCNDALARNRFDIRLADGLIFWMQSLVHL